MGSRYKKNDQQKRNFLPMLCRVSSKDVRLSQHKLNGTLSFSKEPSSPKVSCIGKLVNNNNNKVMIGFPTAYKHNSTTTPSSKTTSSINNINRSNVKHTKPKNLLVMIKNAISVIAGAAVANSNSSGNVINVNACRSRRCTGTRKRCIIKRRIAAATGKPSEKSTSGGCKNGYVDEAKIMSEMDPPLPVIKKVRPPHRAAVGCCSRGDEVNLWKRRRCGAPLRALQTDHFHFTSSPQFSSARATT